MRSLHIRTGTAIGSDPAVYFAQLLRRKGPNQQLLLLRVEWTAQQFSRFKRRPFREHALIWIKIRGMGGAAAEASKNQNFQSFFRTFS